MVATRPAVAAKSPCAVPCNGVLSLASFKERRLPMCTDPTCRFSSCHAICSGRYGFAPAYQGKPTGVPSSWGSQDARVIGGRDQCGAVIKACSPKIASTTSPRVRKVQATMHAPMTEATSRHGSTCSVWEKGGVAGGSRRRFVGGLDALLFVPASTPPSESYPKSALPAVSDPLPCPSMVSKMLMFSSSQMILTPWMTSPQTCKRFG
mmetsp:Transcript_88923/g.176894  ORF Transcript_88923/g.176894 Transcript_88923/m.176894 type:complete len:207 (-) Transcript_88923:366-986(-)